MLFFFFLFLHETVADVEEEAIMFSCLCFKNVILFVSILTFVPFELYFVRVQGQDCIDI